MNSKFDRIRECISAKIRWFQNISGLAKFVLVLCVLISIFNIGGNIYSANKINEAQVKISQKVEEQKDLVEQAFSGLDMQDTVQTLCDSFASIGKVAMLLIALIISILVSFLVNYICKPMDWFRKIAEIFAELDEDWIALKYILIYDVINILFSIYTI